MSLKPETITPDTITPDVITQLATMIQADPALTVQLQSCTDAASSAAVIAKAAAAKGMDVSEPSLVAHFEAATAKQGAMSDADLEQVAGGAGNETAWLISIFGVGLGCAIASIVGATQRNNSCSKELNNPGKG